ncbi:acyl-CoA thioesterase [Novosphingobium pentaromativorans]|uniref:Acyl-CoA thioesterase YciA n=1 Tax=Novosphingobium pentaromativorans US6-1 TaxID=1088721 RepID=G6EJ20_9SPHN|nr:acyl-CoA thioesterase [Novosphingobium pentaromativorans]AIT78980.1 acyl-CoA thioester hydrolase [Novosphingobium pentaromativorans US6-1]EHJ58779.1 acyl-CoA thioesterase YciA [Novosphingobium pentaromativorans US6-1]
MEPRRDPVIRVTAMPADANAYGDIFGGWLMSLMDMGAGLIAARHSHGRAVTVAMDGMQFHLPVKVGDEVSVYGELRRVGRSSMTIGIEAWRRHRHEEEEVKVTQAVFTFVAVDNSGKPRTIEPGRNEQEI